MEKNFFCTFFDDNLFGHHSFGSAAKKTNAQNQIIVSSSAAAKKIIILSLTKPSLFSTHRGALAILTSIYKTPEATGTKLIVFLVRLS